MSNEDRLRDEMHLDMMHMVEVLDESCTDVGIKYGVTKNVVIGIRFRTRRDSEGLMDYCKKPENKNGGMPAGWWRQ